MIPSDNSDHDEDLRSKLKNAWEAPPPREEFVAELEVRLQAELAAIAPLGASPVVASPSLPFRLFNVFTSRRMLAAAAIVLAVSTGWLGWQTSRLQAARDQQASLRNETATNLQQALAAIDRFDRAVHDGQKLTPRDVALMRKDGLQAAVAGYETLVKVGEGGATDASKLDLARAQLRLAQATAATGDKAQAIDRYLQGLSTLEQLAQNHPESAGYPDDLANGYHNLGVLYRDQGQTVQADRAFQQALNAYRHSRPGADADAERALRLGALYSERAVAQAAAGNWNAARDWYTQAIQTLGTVPQAQLSAQDSWRSLFQALAGRSRILAALGLRTESLQDWDQALELANRFSRPSPDPIVGPAGKPLIWGADAIAGAPFVFEDPKNPGTLIGYEMDLAKALARQMGRPIQFKQHKWVTLLQGLEKGEMDIAMNGVEIMPERLQKFRFSRPYYISKLQLVVRADEQRIRSVADCRDRKDIVIGTLGNTAAEWQLDRLRIKRKSYEGQIEPFTDLILGRIDGVLADLPAADYYVRQKQNPKVKYGGEAIAPCFYAIAVHPKNEAILSEINVALERLLQSGELRRIYEKWNLWNADQEGLQNVKDLIDPLRQAESGPGKQPN
jgi:ABC-type amino acid transport substrate-binding protein